MNANDVFGWGCADAEDIAPEEIESLYQAWLSGSVTKWICMHRKEKPQPPLEKRMRESGEWDELYRRSRERPYLRRP